MEQPEVFVHALRVLDEHENVSRWAEKLKVLDEWNLVLLRIESKDN